MTNQSTSDPNLNPGAEDLTAFAIGEASDFNPETATSEELQEIEDLKLLAGELEQAFAEEPKETLSQFQKNSLFRKQMKQASKQSMFRKPPVIFGAGLALAASVLLLINFMLQPSHLGKMRPIAKQDKVIKVIKPMPTPKPQPMPPTPIKVAQKEMLFDAAKGRIARALVAKKIQGPPAGFFSLQVEAEVEPTGNGIDKHEAIDENKFIQVADDPRSTFSVDVDTASYAELRQMLRNGTLPSADAVKVEELVNYFNYDYQLPANGEDFASQLELATCPWNTEHKLVRVAIKGREVSKQMRKSSNLVFLIDVSGSMSYANKLPLLKRSLKLLVEQLDGRDTLSIVVYAGASGLVLKPTKCDEKATIMATLDNLEAGGSTNGGAGIQLAYKLARQNFIDGGNNRVILCTDGDFNVGTTGKTDLVSLAKRESKGQTFMTVLGFGRSFNSALLSKLSQEANGQHAFIDSWSEAKKLFVDQMTGTLETIAKDMKIQVEFNPRNVKSYRLIGYENRLLAHSDFNNDKKDAGDIGAGHTVTAFYELELTSGDEKSAKSDLKYQEKGALSKAAMSSELLTVKIRHKKPDAQQSTLKSVVLKNNQNGFSAATSDFQFAASVALFGMLLRKSKNVKSGSLELVDELVRSNLGSDEGGYRAEFLSLVKLAKQLTKATENSGGLKRSDR